MFIVLYNDLSSIDRPSSTVPVTGANYPSSITEGVRCFAWPKSLLQPDMRTKYFRMACSGHNRRLVKRSDVEATEETAYHRRWPPIKNLNTDYTTIHQPAQNQENGRLEACIAIAPAL